MKRQYFENGIRAEFNALYFGESILDPVKATIMLTKYDCVGHCNFAEVAHCFYDVCTQNIWMDEHDDVFHMVDGATKDSICAFAKKILDAIFYDAEGYEKHLVEILCHEEFMVLGDSVYPFTTTQYSLYQGCGGYELQIPMLSGGGATDELLHRVNKSSLPWDLAFPLNRIVLADPSFLNRKYMISRVPGRRDGINFVRGCQRRVEEVLRRAEEYIKIVNEYRERINAQQKKQPSDCN